MPVPFRQRVKVLSKAAVGLFSDRSLEQMQQELLEGAFTSGGAGGLAPTVSNREFLRSYGTMPWLRAVAGKIAFHVASTDWKLYVLTKKDRGTQRVVAGPQVKTLQRADSINRKQMLMQKQASGELREITDHPLLDALESGNSVHTGLSVRKLETLYLDLTGQCFLLKERNRVQAPVALWPLPPHWVVTTPTPTSRYYDVQIGSFRQRFPDTEILWMSDPDPYNPYGRGVGQAASVADELEIDTYASKMAKQVFFNQGKPDFMVTPKEGVMAKQDMSRLERFWVDRIQGFWNVAKPIFLPRPVEVKEFTHDFRNFQFTDLRRYQRDVVMQVFGIPPEVMGVLNNSNRATIDSSDYLMGKYITTPRLEFQRAQLQERLVPEYDARLIIDYVSPIAEDHDFKLKAFQANPATPTVDEWRELQHLQPLPDNKGQVHMVDFNKVIVSDFLEAGSGNSGSDTPSNLRHLNDEELAVARYLSEKIHARR